MNSKAYDHPKRRYTIHPVRRSVRALIGPKNRNTTFIREPDRYYAHVWINRRLWEAILFLTRVNGLSKMETARQLLEAGISKVLTDAIRENRQMQEHGRPATPLIRELIKWARSEGYAIDGLL